MNKIEILDLIANGENSSVEFKRDDIRPEQLAKGRELEKIIRKNLKGIGYEF